MSSYRGMRGRTDPLVPVLASAVSIVVIGAIALIFFPRVSRLLDRGGEVSVQMPPAADATVPVWLGRTEDGVALLLQEICDSEAAALLDGALREGPHRYLSLRVYNFSHRDAFTLEPPASGFASPEGGAAARPAAALLREDAPAHLRTVLGGFGAVRRLEVAQGHFGQMLLVVPADPSRRTAFQVTAELRLERRELERRVLASWRQQPDWGEFRDFG